MESGFRLLEMLCFENATPERLDGNFRISTVFLAQNLMSDSRLASISNLKIALAVVGWHCWSFYSGHGVLARKRFEQRKHLAVGECCPLARGCRR
jgi:hypothetical protein